LADFFVYPFASFFGVGSSRIIWTGTLLGDAPSAFLGFETATIFCIAASSIFRVATAFFVCGTAA
jgi:hypothetical protein